MARVERVFREGAVTAVEAVVVPAWSEPDCFLGGIGIEIAEERGRVRECRWKGGEEPVEAAVEVEMGCEPYFMRWRVCRASWRR